MTQTAGAFSPHQTSESSSHFLSQIDPALLRTRMPGSEGLAEAMLKTTADEDIGPVVYVLHDWFVLHRQRGFETIAKYFDQPKKEVDSAISLFIKNRDEVCLPKDVKPNQYPLLQLYLLFDCLVHVGSIKRRARTISYLSRPQKHTAAPMDVREFLETGESGQVHNYVVIDGEPRIDSKIYFHSELAGGRPVEASGETCLKRTKEGKVASILINDFSGHYRIADSTFRMGAVVNAALDADAVYSASQRPNVYLTHEPLVQLLQ